MATTWEDVEIQAMTYIKNDLLLEEDLHNRLPVFYWKMCAYMKLAIPRFNRPPEIIVKLSKTTTPQFDSIIYTAQSAIPIGTQISTGETGYDIVSCGKIADDAYGVPQYTPIGVASYNSATGVVTLSQALAENDEVTFDFYKSASFTDTLNATEQDLLAFCIYVAWEHRFSNNAIERTSKVRDSSFTPISEATMTNANSARLRDMNEELFDRLRAYEQDKVYLEVVEKYSI